LKVDIDDLAVFGGTPAFKEKKHVGRPNIGNREKLLIRINDLLDRRWLSNNGPYVLEFERKICELIGVKNCIATCNGTAALQIVVRAIGLKNEVLVPSFTFVATAHALQWLGITPIFCDVDATSHNLDPKQVERNITSHTTGIIGVHLWGRPCNIDKLSAIAYKNDLKLLFDAAHAFGCSYKGTMIGNFGNAEVFSFHATKFVNAFEGGAIVTNDDDLAHSLRLMRDFGFAGYDNVVKNGTNGKMNEASAAMGLTSLESLREFVDINYRNYRRYREELSGVPGISLLDYNKNDKCNYQYIVLEIDDTITQVNRDQIVQILWAENIIARRYFHPGCHRMEPYKSALIYAGLELPVTERLARCLLCLPTGTTITEDDIHKICAIILLVVTNSTDVLTRLTSINVG
jgi:dTDP-4-amino-4,6-dideoxygalactose transaminase